MEFISVVLAGVLIFVLGQLILKVFIEPVQQFKKTMAEIAHTSVRYSLGFPQFHGHIVKHIADFQTVPD
jgi:hypothetical protein